MDREIQIGEVYRHFKGDTYRVIAIANHTETGDRLVIYKALYGDGNVYARPYDMFAGEIKCKLNERESQRYRFELVIE